MEEDKHLQLLDVLGIPLSSKRNISKNIIFSHKEKSLIYTLGSNIIRYNLKNDSKTFLQYFTKNIISIKYIQDNLNLLIIISENSPFPILSIWKMPSFQGLFSQELIINNDFEYENIYIEQFNSSSFVILIANKNEPQHYLFVLNILNEINFEIYFLGKIKNILPKLIGFGSFYKSNDIAFLMKYNLQIFSVDLFKTRTFIKKNVNFSFSLKENSLNISKISNFLCFLTEKGNCLIYDNNGNDIFTINPIGQEFFVSCQFCEKSLCLGCDNGNIYVYNIYGFILKYMIRKEDIINIKNFSLINNTNYNRYANSSNEENIIIQASVDENNDQLFCLFKNTSFFLLSITQLLDNTTFRYNIKPLKINSTTFFSFNHTNKIIDICLKPSNYQNNHKRKETRFYTCAQDNKLILYNIEQGTDKIKNLYYDLNPLLSLSKVTNNSSNYITSIQLHPLFSHKLYAGDNKGFLYLIYLNPESNNKYKKYNIDSFGIIYLTFASNGVLLFIGLETGKQLVYKTNKSLECVLKLNEHFFSYDEIDFRRANNYKLSFGYFFSNKTHRHCLIYFKNNNILEYNKLFKNENNTQIIKKKIMDIIFNYSILDIAMHKSENYIIVLDSKKQILIHNINENKINAVIDLGSQMDKIYNIQIDISGLYLAVICDIKLKNKNNLNHKNKTKNKNDLIIIEISSSKVKNLIIQNSPMSKAVFDNEGKYVIIGGENGEISLWRLPGNISSNIKDILGEIKNDENFWDKYEIKYGKFLPYNFNNYNDDDFSLTTTSFINYNNSNNLSSTNLLNTNEKDLVNYEATDDSISNNISNSYLDVDDKYRKNHRLSKSLTYKINNRKNNLKYFGRNNGFQKTTEYYDNKINNFKENGMPKSKFNYKYNIDLSNYSNYLKEKGKFRDNRRYNFWSSNDTIKIKNSININGHNKYPEPKDIDNYLLK